MRRIRVFIATWALVLATSAVLGAQGVAILSGVDAAGWATFATAVALGIALLIPSERD